MVTLWILWNISWAVSLVPLAFTLLTQAHAPVLYHCLSPEGHLLGLQKITGSRSENEVLSHQRCVCLRKRTLWVFSIVFPIWLASSIKTDNECSWSRAPFLPLPGALHHDSDRPLAIPTQTTHELQALSLFTTNPHSYLPPTLCPHPCHTPGLGEPSLH